MYMIVCTPLQYATCPGKFRKCTRCTTYTINLYSSNAATVPQCTSHVLMYPSYCMYTSYWARLYSPFPTRAGSWRSAAGMIRHLPVTRGELDCRCALCAGMLLCRRWIVSTPIPRACRQVQAVYPLPSHAHADRCRKRK